MSYQTRIAHWGTVFVQESKMRLTLRRSKETHGLFSYIFFSLTMVVIILKIGNQQVSE
jgi:hypothetical protein